MSRNASTNFAKETWVNFRPDTTNYSFGAFGKGCPHTLQLAPAEASSNSIADVKLSPNPNQGSFSVALSGFVSTVVDVKISNLNSGKVYYIGKANNNSTTNISIHVPNGNYVVELADGKNVVTRKVTILN